MVTHNHIGIFRSLVPASLIYDGVTRFRNLLYNKQWLTTKSYPLPVICIGNLAIGGTGKTPHTEYLIQLLQSKGLQVATLSRGYKRKTKGFLKANMQSSVSDIGDEPWQLLHNHPDITVAVDEDRCHGIEQLLQEQPSIDVILLDDAFQHRAVKAGLNILLTDYHRLYSKDMVLPAGQLRESKKGAKRADLVVVTKCPADLSELEANDIKAGLHLLPHQQLFFTSITYKEPEPVFEKACTWPPKIDETYTILAITGIANPNPMLAYLRTFTPKIDHIAYPDHHDFTDSDLLHLQQIFDKLPTKRIIITTQKDAARLQALSLQLNPTFKQHLFALHITINIMFNQQSLFNKSILATINNILKATKN
ncbi:MAG: tetraacyldisaccharide 4'-kinase [Bacteroidaceae bacterium]|nr:tetraacyldisaccharide 4'-kinase [Bacteroidaceae bacterium]